MSTKTATKKSVRKTAAKGKTSGAFTAEERAVIKGRVAEMKREGKADGESDLPG